MIKKVNEMQNRWRSPVLWVSIFALVVFILKEYFQIEIPKVDTLIDMILVVATGVGLINNPTDKENW